MTSVVLERLNANEDEAVVVEVLVADGDEVTAGTVVCVVETTKTTTEVIAPASGRVTLRVEVDAVVQVGGTLFEVDGPQPTGPDPGPASRQEAPRITAKARRRAQELGIDVATLEPRDGVIDVALVEAATPARHPEPAMVVRGGNRAAADAVPALVIGGGGHGAMILDALRSSGFRVEAVLDRDLPVGTPVLHGIEVTGRDDDLEGWWSAGVRHAFVGVGGATDNEPRRRLFERLRAAGFELPALVHERAYVGGDAEIGPGSVVLPGAVVGPRCTVGADVIVNQAAQVSHDTVIDDHVHLAPGALVAGHCRVGAGTTIGMAATVLDHTRIGRRCLIHNNASVTGDLGEAVELHRDGSRRRRPEAAADHDEPVRSGGLRPTGRDRNGKEPR